MALHVDEVKFLKGFVDNFSRGDVKSITGSIDRDESLLNRTLTDNGDTSLTLASGNGLFALAENLLQRGARMVPNGFGITPLMKAACAGHAEVVDLLMGYKANIFAKDFKGRTALDWARIGNKVPVCEILERAIDVIIQDQRQAALDAEREREHQGRVATNNRMAALLANEIEATNLDRSWKRRGLQNAGKMIVRPVADIATGVTSGIFGIVLSPAHGLRKAGGIGLARGVVSGIACVGG